METAEAAGSGAAGRSGWLAGWLRMLRRPELVAATALLVGSIALLAPLAVSNAGHPTKQGTLDQRWTDALVVDHSGVVLQWLDRAFVHVAGLTNGMVASLVALTVCISLLLLGHPRRSWLLPAALSPGILLVNSLKLVAPWPGPDVHLAAQVPQASGWPSGHAASAVLIYLGALVVIGPLLRVRRLRIFLTAMATIAILLVGFARIWTGLHYASGVATGLAGGALWLLLWSLVQHELERRGWLEVPPERPPPGP